MKLEKLIERNGKVLFRATFELHGAQSAEEFLEAFREQFARKYPKASLADRGYVEKWRRIGPARSTGFALSPEARTIDGKPH